MTSSGGKKWFSCEIDSSVFNSLGNFHLSLLSGFDGSETVHPPHFLQGVRDVDFTFLTPSVVIHIFNVSVMSFDQTHFLCVGFSSETCYCLFCTEYLLDISKQLRGSRPSPAAHLNTALLLAVNSRAVDLWK